MHKPQLPNRWKWVPMPTDDRVQDLTGDLNVEGQRPRLRRTRCLVLDGLAQGSAAKEIAS